MVGNDSMGPDLQLVGPRFQIPFPESDHMSSNFAECRYYTKFKEPYIGIVEDRVTWSGMLVVLYVLCMMT